jgi:hypothetical protein
VADKNYALLRENPTHPSLRLKKTGRFWSVRVGSRYRALAVEVEAGLLWFWIGSHSDYDALVLRFVNTVTYFWLGVTPRDARILHRAWRVDGGDRGA